MKTLEEKLIKDFRLLWGIAPEGSLKYEKGKHIEQFLLSALEKFQKELEANYEALLEVKKLRIRKQILEKVEREVVGEEEDPYIVVNKVVK